MRFAWVVAAALAAPAWSQGLKTVDLQSALQGSPQRQGHCTATVPRGWPMRSGPHGDTVDLQGPGLHAAWGIRGVDTNMRAYYGDLFGPPDAAALATASHAIRSPARFVAAAQPVGGVFTARRFETREAVGVVLYRGYPGPGPGPCRARATCTARRAAKTIR